MYDHCTEIVEVFRGELWGRNPLMTSGRRFNLGTNTLIRCLSPIWKRLEAGHLAGLFVALKRDVPADDDDQEPEYPIVIGRNAEISAEEVAGVLTDHGPQQRH